MQGDGTEWIDESLPIPTHHEFINRGYILAYAIDGYFGTNKTNQYLNDIIARFLITFKDLKPSRMLDFKPSSCGAVAPHRQPVKSSNAHIKYYPKIYKLREFQKLKSLKKKQYAPTRADNFNDYVFWSIKLYCEDLIRDQGLATSDQLIQFATSNFIQKDKSTLKAKCRSIWNYYEIRNWQLPKSYKKQEKEKVMATRKENIQKVNENRKRKTQNTIKAILDDIFLQDTIKFKNGKYRIGEIAKLTDYTEKTVSKHLKELNLL